jgi:hypothetical protein
VSVLWSQDAAAKLLPLHKSDATSNDCRRHFANRPESHPSGSAEFLSVRDFKDRESWKRECIAVEEREQQRLLILNLARCANVCA